jgi:hypothetical protein
MDACGPDRRAGARWVHVAIAGGARVRARTLAQRGTKDLCDEVGGFGGYAGGYRVLYARDATVRRWADASMC